MPVPRFQIIADINSENTIVTPAPEPTLSTNFTGSSETKPNKPGPIRSSAASPTPGKKQGGTDRNTLAEKASHGSSSYRSPRPRTNSLRKALTCAVRRRGETACQAYERRLIVLRSGSLLKYFLSAASKILSSGEANQKSVIDE